MTSEDAPGDLISFYRARLDEDEATARAACGIEWSWRDLAQPFGDRASIPHTVHIARHDPARVLREVEGGRRLIDRYERAIAVGGTSPVGFVHGQDDGYRQACLDAISDRAAVYAGHPDYRQEWKP